MQSKLSAATRWNPPADWTRVTTIDAHAEGEPLRVYLTGLPPIEGKSVLGRRKYFGRQLDRFRTALMWEPRGHADMYGCIVSEPVTRDSDFSVIFTHNEGYSTMCGHGIIAVSTVAVTTGLVARSEPETRVGIDTPAGKVEAFVKVRDGAVERVRFRNVPSYVLALDEVVAVPGLGDVRYDLAFGGAYYAYVRASDAGVRCLPEDLGLLIERGMAIKNAVMSARPVEHPLEPDLGFLYGTIFIGDPLEATSHSRNVCVFAEGEVDRSPTGTGVSGRAAIHHARGELGLNEPIAIESILGTKFTVRIVDETTYGPKAAIVPEVEGRAFITGRAEFWLDPKDPLRHGFLLR
jgi:trans-L-3-hydroxyproline dehydratase